MVQNLPSIQETRVRSLDWKDYPGEGNGYSYRILAWRIPWTGKPGGLQSRVRKESDTTD